jgi:hypothetical protein
MALTVEDGTGLTNADALIEVTDVDTYHANFGNATWTGADADKETAIRRASAYLTNSFTWQGHKVNGRSQALSWPRTGVIDEDGYAVPSDAVPGEIEDACAELALRELVTPGTLTPDVTPSDAVKREKIGQLEVEYSNPATNPSMSRPIISIVNDLVGPLLASGGFGSGLVGSSYRV